jgi:hypothetical protein
MGWVVDWTSKGFEFFTELEEVRFLFDVVKPRAQSAWSK